MGSYAVEVRSVVSASQGTIHTWIVITHGDDGGPIPGSERLH